MATQLAKYFQQRRLERGLRLSELARLCGYGNLSRGCNRLHRFESQGAIARTLLDRLVRVLEVDPNIVAQLAEQDRVEFVRKWNAWADQPIKPHVVMRAMPAVFVSQDLPPELTTQEEMEQFAADLAQQRHWKVWLVLSRRVTVYFNESAAARQVQRAEPGGPPNTPFLKMAGSRKPFLFAADGTGLTIKPSVQPPTANET
jgi:transcriptional regulator with XRE-family HTH domain